MVEKFSNFSNYANQSSDILADLNSLRTLQLKKNIPKFSEEAIYIYSLKENRMIYADGWEEVLGYKDAEITTRIIENSPAPEFIVFTNELKHKALEFINDIKEDLELYNIAIELKKVHKNGHLVPVILRIGVFKIENKKVLEIIGNCQINRSLKFGNVMQYYAYGPRKNEFEEIVNKEIFNYFSISEKEKEAITLVSEGYCFKEIANMLCVSKSAIEKRIIPLYKRYNVKSLSQLIYFVVRNKIIP